MLNMSPQEIADIVTRNAESARALVMTDANAIYVAFKWTEERAAYVLVIAPAEQWLPTFCALPVTVHCTTDVQEFCSVGLRWWPGDESLLRMQAMLDFPGCKSGACAQ